MNKEQIAEQLLEIAKNNLAYLEPGADLEDDENEDLWISVRLRCHREDFDPTLRALSSGHYYRDGNVDPDCVDIEILSGGSQFDTDHRGWWGNDYIHVTADREAALEVAASLMDEVEEAIAQESFAEAVKTVEEIKASHEPSELFEWDDRAAMIPLYAWSGPEPTKHLCFVTTKDGEWWFPSVSGLSY
jgi:hypothetical protein